MSLLEPHPRIPVRVWLRWDGPSVIEAAPPHRLVEEPHRLVLEVGAEQLVAQQCACPACAAAPAGWVPETGVYELAAYVSTCAGHLAHRPEIHLQLEDRMIDRRADGTETRALGLAVELRDALAERGVRCRIVAPRPRVSQRIEAVHDLAPR